MVKVIADFWAYKTQEKPCLSPSGCQRVGFRCTHEKGYISAYFKLLALA